MSFEHCGNAHNDIELILSMQSELNYYKDEHALLRKKIDEVVKINESCIQIDLQGATKTDVDFWSYKHLSEKIINTLKEQITYLANEKHIYYDLWKISQQTILNLELEIYEYIRQSNRPDSVKELKNCIKESVQKISDMQHEVAKAKSNKMSLEQSKHLCEAKLKALDKKHNDLMVVHKEVMEQLKGTENILRDNRAQLVNLKRERDEYEKRYTSMYEIHKKYQIRESDAHTKIQEAVCMVEAAISEKNAALEREREIREECDQLALTISRVMEEADNTVEKNIGEIKSDYAKKIQNLEIIIKKLMTTEETLLKCNQISELKAKELEIKLEHLLKTNSVLNVDIQIASKTIIELEIKLQAYEELIACEQANTRESDERSLQLRELLDSNSKLKQRWKETFSEMTNRLQNELIFVQEENSKLANENQKLKTVIAKYENR